MNRKHLSLICLLALILLFQSCSSSLACVDTELSEVEREMIIVEAKKYIGLPYEWGGQSFWWEENPTVDCSGFVINVYKEALPDRTLSFEDSTVLEIHDRWSVQIDEPKAGDLVFMGDGTSQIPSHMGIVVSLENGNLTFIDSSSLPDIMGVSVRSYNMTNPKILSFGRMMFFYM